jgi:hypothetical protein
MRADALVRATILASGRVDQWNSPRRVTSNLEDLPKYYRDKVARSLVVEGQHLRAATSPSPNNQREFDIWFHPEVVGTNPRFTSTVLHELCHGYLGVEKGHNEQWRRLHARVLYHYHWTVGSIDHWPALVDLANWSYTKRGKSESTRDFLKRISADKDRWIRQADENQQKVNDIWCKMMNLDWVRKPPSPRQRKSQDS